ncbi:hypothetical protein Aperf_G00000064562 [Anoplocephala perfoliata]
MACDESEGVLPWQIQWGDRELISLLRESVCSRNELFLVELFRNAAIALRKAGLPSLDSEKADLFIKVAPNKSEGTLTVVDNGFGMSKDDLIKNLGTLAHSDAKFLALNDCNLPQTAKSAPSFQSIFRVADKVQVTSKTDASGSQFFFEFHSGKPFTVRSCDEENLDRGTKVVLHLKKKYADFLLSSVLEDFIHKYVEFIGFPIKLISYKEGGAYEERLINDVPSVWMQNPEEVRHEDYVELYKYLSDDTEEPLYTKHFSCPGETSMRGVLFIPKQYHKDTAQHGVEVYLNQVLLTDSLETLFEGFPHDHLYGVIDLFNLHLTSDCSDSVLRKGKKEIYAHLREVFLEWFKAISESEDVYCAVCENLKPLLLFLYRTDARFAGFLRYYSSKSGNLKISLDEYISRMKEDQRVIYIALGDNVEMLRDLPAAEKLHQSGIEVLYTSNPADYSFICDKNCYKLYKIRSVGSYANKIELSKEEEREYRESCVEFASTCSTMENYYEGGHASVRVSRRLVNSPCCAFVGGKLPFGEPLKPSSPREEEVNFEINPNHEVLIRLKELCCNNDGNLNAYAPIINILLETALIDSGFMPPDPIRYADMVYELIGASLNVSKTTEMPKETEERALYESETSSPILAADKGGDVDCTP